MRAREMRGRWISIGVVPQSQHPPGVQKGEPEMSSEPGPIRPSAEPRAESMGRAHIAAFPLLSLAIFTLDVLVVYGLIAHGGRTEGV